MQVRHRSLSSPPLARRLALPRTAALLAAAVVPTLAIAHPGHGVDGAATLADAFVAGLAHPFSGLDHLVALLAVGAWGAAFARRGWIVPAAGLGMLLVGFALATAAAALPGIEIGIAASLIVMGALLAARIGPRIGHRAAWAPALAGACALWHGLAHGQAFAGLAPFLATASGLALGSAVILAAGAFATRGLDRVWAPRLIGATAAVVGVVSLAGLAA